MEYVDKLQRLATRGVKEFHSLSSEEGHLKPDLLSMPRWSVPDDLILGYHVRHQKLGFRQ